MSLRYLLTLSSLCLSLFVPFSAYAQDFPSAALSIPSPLSVVPTAQQQSALNAETPEQDQLIQSVIIPQMQQIMQGYNAQQTASGTFLSWQQIISNASSGVQNAPVVINSSAIGIQVPFINSSGSSPTYASVTREYHPALAVPSSPDPGSGDSGGGDPPPPMTNSLRLHGGPVPGPSCDQDGDGLPDYAGAGGQDQVDLEDAVASNFMPVYHISTGEQQQFATFADSVPWTVVNTVGTNPPNSYYHVTPLGTVTNTQNGQAYYAIRVDYLSLWNGDGGLIGGGGACFYSYFGLDTAVQALSSHNLDDERSAMLLAAPAVNGGMNPDPNAYSLYSLYTAAHEGTFFDQSMYFDFTTPVPPGNHVNLGQSLSKHSSYTFNSNFYPITPYPFIEATIDVITDAWVNGDIDDVTYLLLLGAADDTFYGCLVERFGDQGGQSPNPVINVGEVAHPLNFSHFIQDNSNPLKLSDKLTVPIF